MINYDKNKDKVADYLIKLKEKKYRTTAAFCKDYIKLSNEYTDDVKHNLENRFSQIFNEDISKRKYIQIYDLPILSKIFDVSCEEILSAGKHCAPTKNHITNYYIANSHDPKEWEEYIKRKDRLFLNCDEYCKSVLDYALEFRNYDFIKYLIENEYIKFEKFEHWEKGGFCFLADTTIKPDMNRENNLPDIFLPNELKYSSELRIKIISLAIENGDIPVLETMNARILPEIYNKYDRLHSDCDVFKDSRNPAFLETLACSENQKIIDYFSEEYLIDDIDNNGNKFVFAFMGEVIDVMLEKEKYDTAKTFIEKAIEHNKATFEKLSKIISESNSIYCKAMNIEPTDKRYNQHRYPCTFFHNEFNNIVFLFTHYGEHGYTKILTNIVSVKSPKADENLKPLVIELNRIYNNILSLKKALEDNNVGE